MVVMADLCLDEYTDHGHCGVVDRRRDVDNDATLELYAGVAIAQADAGVDVVAPSGMMDGQVRAIRGALDDDAAPDVAILAYSAKYASALYGPFRDAVDVEIADGGDRRATSRTGATPARRSRRSHRRRRGRRHGDGEARDGLPRRHRRGPGRGRCAGRGVPRVRRVRHGHAAAERGWIDGDAVALEQLSAIKRAGADLVLTYFARRVAERAAVMGAGAPRDEP